MRIRKPAAILIDIEGTTTSVRFVSDILFPFIKSHLKRYLKENWGKPELMITIDRLRDTCTGENSKSVMPAILDSSEPNADNILKSVVANVLWQMEERKRNAALKQLQLLVWVYGYEQGHIKGQHDCGTTTAVFLFHIWQSTSGSKSDPESYKKISAEITLPPDQILFLTDNPKEANAALKAGLQAIIVKRPGNKTLAASDFQNFLVINSFEEIDFVETASNANAH